MGAPFLQAKYQAKPIIRYKIVQPGPKSQFGGEKLGLFKNWYQELMAEKVNKLPIKPASWGKARAVNSFMISWYHILMSDLQEIAKLVRYYILTCTTKAGSGHPTSSLSATDLMTELYFNRLRLDFDRIIFSKGHASPLFFSLYTAAGLLPEKELYTLRQFGSVVEGHPTPKFKYAEAASGSLGQGLSVGLGMALNGKYLDRLPYFTYVLMGDSEMAEGSVWEAINLAGHYKLDNLVGIIDVNRLGQANPTMLGWDTETYSKRVQSFGWETAVIEGHNFSEITRAFDQAGKVKNKPLMIIAKTIKGKGVSFLEDKEGWHGKALNQADYQKALKELGTINFKLKCFIKKQN